MTPTLAPYRFLRLLHAEWTKIRTVRGWVTGMMAAALMMVLVALLVGVSGNQRGSPPVPIGPDGGPVTDSFYFVHRPMAGNGSITVSVSALNSSIPKGPGDLRPGTVPWAKAGLIIKESTRQGSPYAAIMATGSHGVRMQDGYVNDTAGPPGPVSAESPRWLRLDRSGDAITGYASADGRHWTTVGTAQLSGLGSTAQVGLFVASPPAVGGGGTAGSVSRATFEGLRTQEGWSGGHWTGGQVGAESPSFAGYPENASGSFTGSDARFTVTGAGDIAPAVRDSLPTGGHLRDILTGTFAALIAVIVVGALFITEEYRNKMIHLTLAVSPRRSRVLVAKAIVLWAVTFVAGLVGAILATPLGERLARGNGVYIFPVSSSTELRVALGTAALLATASVLALAVGAIFRHSAVAVTTAIVAVVLTYILIAIPFMPAGVSKGVATVTPGAAFAVQQTLVPYDQVASNYQEGRMRPALHAEWTKIRTVASTLWLLLGMIAATMALSSVATSVVTCTASGCGRDTTKLTLMGVYLGQAMVAILAALTISGEYGTGMIRTTLTAVPRRATAFAAKAIALTGVVAVGGTVAVLGSVLAGRLILPDLGDQALSLADGPTLRAVFGTVLYLILIGLLSFGIATAVRDSATSIGGVLGLLYVVPIVSQTVSDPDWQRLLEKMAPMSAGLTIQATTDLGSLPISPWAGLGVTAGWAAAALVAGGLLLRKRDA